jgi:tRNA-2-methylthio-N6-dimethylallyladenosine synthase
VLNTCSVRQKAEDRIYSFCTKFHKMRKNRGKQLVIAVTGCMPGRDHDGAIRKRLPMVDLFFDIQRITELPQMLSEVNRNIPSGNRLDDHYLHIQPDYKNTYQAFIPIQTGCNKFCTYCVVPFSRGLEVNRPLGNLLDEIKRFADQGGKEVTLLGQTVNSYLIDDRAHLSTENPYSVDFACLLWEANQIDGIERIHFTAPHPRDMQDEVVDALGLPKHLNYLHLPVQSGSNSVLKRMNRPYTSEMYVELIEKIYKKHPNIALATDIIVGFCGETEQDFQETIDLYKRCQFDVSYTAQYSERSGTLAYKGMEDDVPHAVKKQRWRILQNIMEDIAFKKNQRFSNQSISVLFDEYDSEKGMALGWSHEMKKVRVKSPFRLDGHILDVQVTDPQVWILEGKVLNMPDRPKLEMKASKGLPML